MKVLGGLTGSIRTGLIAAFTTASLAISARADVLVLSNGGRLEGRVAETPSGWVLRTETGSITFERAEVVEVIHGRTALEGILEVRAALAPEDAAGRARLAARAEATGCPSTAEQLWNETLALDPDNAAAREALGFTRVEGRWLTADEAMASAGYVKVSGAWLSRAEFESRLAALETERAAAEAEAARAEAERARSDAARAEADRRAAEARLEELTIRLLDNLENRRYFLLLPRCPSAAPPSTGIRVPPEAALTDDRFVTPNRDPYAAPPWALPPNR
ncbi:MAG: hypothetical protein HYY18_09380 [Planctomycetes bacterium]|nr:hypothetical protein [Planctomycetota bacterium]